MKVISVSFEFGLAIIHPFRQTGSIMIVIISLLLSLSLHTPMECESVSIPWLYIVNRVFDARNQCIIIMHVMNPGGSLSHKSATHPHTRTHTSE